MVDEQKSLELLDKLAPFVHGIGKALLAELMAELQTLREERTACRVTAESAEAAVKQARIDALDEALRMAWKNETAAGAARAIESLKAKHEHRPIQARRLV